ncbi:MAG: hypothetical protein V4611_03360 [Patescibacteria group bacterium]
MQYAMQSPVTIVRTVHQQKNDPDALLRGAPLPWQEYDTPMSTVGHAIQFTLGFLGACPDPYPGAELVDRSLTTKSSKTTRVVETAIWPIFRFNPIQSRDGLVQERELVMDAYGDLMARLVSRSPGHETTYSWPRLLDTSSLHVSYTERVFITLEKKRGELLDQFINVREPSPV